MIPYKVAAYGARETPTVSGTKTVSNLLLSAWADWDATAPLKDNVQSVRNAIGSLLSLIESGSRITRFEVRNGSVVNWPGAPRAKVASVTFDREFDEVEIYLRRAYALSQVAMLAAYEELPETGAWLADLDLPEGDGAIVAGLSSALGRDEARFRDLLDGVFTNALKAVDFAVRENLGLTQKGD